MKKILFLIACLCFSNEMLQADREMDESLKSDKKVQTRLAKERVVVGKAIDSSKCDLYCNAAPEVIGCKLYPPINETRECSLLYAKAIHAGKAYERYEFEVEQDRCADNAEAAESIGQKIMLAKPMPNSKKKICGYYLKCLRSYVNSLPTTNPLIDNLPDRGSFKIKEKYLEIEAFCSNNAYTIELTRIKDIIQNGLNRGLKATEPELISLKEVSKRVIFINPKKGEIKNVPLKHENYSVRTGYKQAYDHRNCKVYLEALDKKEDRESNRAVVRVTSSTPNKRFDEKTRLVFEIMDVEPMIDVNWYYLAHNQPIFSKKDTYVKTNTASKRIFGKQEWFAQMREIVKGAEQMHIENRCDIDDLKEFTRGYWWHVPAYKLSYEYDMHVRPSTKSEIRQARSFLKHMKNSFKDRQLYKTLNNGKLIYKWKNRPKNQKKLKKEMDDEIDLFTD